MNPLLQKASTEGLPIQPLIILFHPTEGIPPRCENSGKLLTFHLFPLFIYSLKELAYPIEEWFQQHKNTSDGFGPPICIISDLFLGSTQDTTTKFGIPRIVFHTSGSFVVSLSYSFLKYMPEIVESDDDTVHFPQLPNHVSFPKHQIFPLGCIQKISYPVSEFIKNINKDSRI